MQVFDIQTDRDSLATFGTEAIAGLCAGDFFGLANRFGYMRAFDRNHAVALKSDLTSSIAKIEGATRLLGAAHASVVVKYFKPNDVPLFALIECRVQTDAGSDVLLELVVIATATNNHISIEDISSE